MNSLTLLLRLAGPMQSWGTQSRFSNRDTGRDPSKSGVVGLLASALGRPRDVDPADLAGLHMAVRVDREGHVARDYQTVLPLRGGSDAIISERYYLADADFLVGLAGSDELLTRLHAALRAPRWPLFLGRKAYVPSQPPVVGLLNQPLDRAIREQPWPRRRSFERPPDSLRLVTEDPEGPELRQDVPLSFAARRFDTRRVHTEFIPVPTQEEALCHS
jgi:CRISPR system Cascade subunit CasD